MEYIKPIQAQTKNMFQSTHPKITNTRKITETNKKSDIFVQTSFFFVWGRGRQALPLYLVVPLTVCRIYSIEYTIHHLSPFHYIPIPRTMMIHRQLRAFLFVVWVQRFLILFFSFVLRYLSTNFRLIERSLTSKVLGMMVMVTSKNGRVTVL